jgi:hypothetical protein
MPADGHHFVPGGMELTSEEGTTQGCPLAMVMYAIALMPLIDLLRPSELPDIGNGVATQAWYADDAQAAARLEALRRYWDKLVKAGPRYGYYPKASKTFCVLKPGMRAKAERIFAGTGIQLTDEGPGLEHKNGQRQLGAAIGTKAFIEQYVAKKVTKWSQNIAALADIAKTQPHAAYAAYVYGERHRPSFVQRALPNIGKLLEPLRDAVREKLAPALLGRNLGDLHMKQMRLPAREGGLSLDDSADDAPRKHADSKECTEQLT